MRTAIARIAPCLALSALVLLSAGLAGCGESGGATDCLCANGRAGETLWCPPCAKGWIDGVATTDKAAVDRALAALVEKAAAERGLSGSEVDRILGDIAAGVVKKPACSCQACATGEPHEHAPTDSGRP